MTTEIAVGCFASRLSVLNQKALKVFNCFTCKCRGRDSSVGIATRYGLGARFSAPV